MSIEKELNEISKEISQMNLNEREKTESSTQLIFPK